MRAYLYVCWLIEVAGSALASKMSNIAVIMNSLSQLSRWNRFRLLRAKETTPSPSPAKRTPAHSRRSVCSNLSAPRDPTPQGRRPREALTLTTRQQNRCVSPSQQEGSSLSTKRNAAVGRREESASLERFASGGKRVGPRHRVNYSILQRIRRTLELYPAMRVSSGPKTITFATQSQDEAQQSGEAINLQKLVLWRQSKVVKVAERIYECAMQAGAGCVQEEVRRCLLGRYKTAKLCRQNFVNLLYSLFYYADKFQYELSLAPRPALARLRSLVLFQKFITLQYSQDDLIFYLYSRSLLLQAADDHAPLSPEQLRRFLTALANGDSCIVRYYEQFLARATGRQGLDASQVLELLLADFRQKKSTATLQSASGEEVSRAERALRASRLSCSRLRLGIDRAFWRTDPPSSESIPESLYEKLLEQTGAQTKKLTNLFAAQAGRAREACAELILIKAIRMLNAVHERDQCRWWEEMQLVRERVLVAQPVDFQQIDGLQRDLRAIEQDQKAGRLAPRQVVDFAKRLLTVRAFVDRLQELFDAVEDHFGRNL